MSNLRAEFLTDLGKRMRSLRRERHLSLDQLAANIDMSKAGLWAIEKGQSDPQASTLVRLSIALHSTIDYIVRGE